MNLDFRSDNKFKFNRFSKLGMLYILALSVIATIAIVGQVLIQGHLQNQVSDSRVVNLAGIQRYKSQWIVKMSLLISAGLDHGHSPDSVKRLENLLEQWKRGHYGLQHGDQQLNLPGGNSEQITQMFIDLEPYFQQVYNSTKAIIQYKRAGLSDTTLLRRAMRTLLDNETVFLQKMDHIVFQYDQEAQQKVAMLSKLEYLLLGVTILVIGLEIIFVFRPTTVQVNRAINQLMSSEKNARKLSKEIGALYASLEKSYEQISIVNQPVENPRLYAKADRGGGVTFIADAFATLSGQRAIESSMRLSDLFPGMNNPDEWMDEIVDVLSEGGTWQGEIRFESARGKMCWVDAIITPVYHDKDNIEELVLMGSDITRRKEAEQNMNRKNRAEIEKKINQQKFRSVLILEGQEEERKRIAMDIHDGIGQMLTSLKFQIESIDLKEGEKAAQKIGEIEQLIKEVIKEVRKVTFNLKPTVLGDYGVQAALNVFIQEIGKLTDTKLVYRTSGEIERLPQKTENNIFRIIQEAINNAIKYAGAEVITVDLKKTGNDLTIMVKDEGRGFDTKLVEARNMNIESGRGFFNMYERTEYINGTLTIDSAPGKGTTVVLTVPVRSMATADSEI
jgi:two-component system, NarL family, sensor histidine kinase DegS